MPLAYSYVRFSSRQQATGDSIRRQLEASRDYCARHGLTLADADLADHGVSAFRGRNAVEGALGRFLELVEAGEVPRGSRLIVESLDRLSRDAVMAAFSVLQRIVSAGVVVVTLIDGEREYSGSMGWDALLWALMVMARAHDESKTKSSRSRANWQRKRQLAAEGQGMLTTRLPDWLRMVDGKPQPDPERVAVLRKMYRLTLEEGLGVRAIAKRLDEAGVKPWGRARHWPASTVHKYLTTRAVLGEFQPQAVDSEGRKVANVGEPVAGYFPAVIEAAEFERVQVVRGPRMKQVPGPKDRALLLSGLLRCGACGGGMAHFPKRPDDVARYRCRRFCGGNRGWPVEALEELIMRAMVNRALVPLLSVDGAARLREVGEELQALEGRAQSLSAQIDRLLDAVEAGTSSAAAQRLREREAERATVQRQREALQAERSALQARTAAGPASDVWRRLADLQELRTADPDGFNRRAGVALREALGGVVLLAPINGASWAVTLVDRDGGELDRIEMFGQRFDLSDARFTGSGMAVSAEWPDDDEAPEPDELRPPPKPSRKRPARATGKA
jgi:DNA invertase Pin-like site-specific DNA recombinase